MRRLLPAAALVAAATLSSCSAAASEEAAASAARFERGLSAHPDEACALLAPPTREELESSTGKPCTEALPEADLPVARGLPRVTVAGHSAQAVLDDDTVFLALFDDGWRVIAAGCERRSADTEIPYDCSVKAG